MYYGIADSDEVVGFRLQNITDEDRENPVSSEVNPGFTKPSATLSGLASLPNFVVVLNSAHGCRIAYWSNLQSDGFSFVFCGEENLSKALPRSLQASLMSILICNIVPKRMVWKAR